MTTQEDSLIGLVEISKQEARVLMEAGYLSIEMGRFKEAEEIFQGCIALLPRNSTPHLGLGNLYVAQDRLKEAIASYKEAIRINETPDAQAFLGEAYLLNKQNREGIAALNRALELSQEGPAADLARSLLQAEKEGVFN